MTTYFTSDLHFGHKNIITFCNRPYKDTQEMNEELIKNYRNVVTDRDTVIFVGDVFFVGKERAKEIMARLPGYKILVRGNHDRDPAWMLDVGFDAVVDTMRIRVADRMALVSHYPYRPLVRDAWAKHYDKQPERKDGQLLIHGHTHSKEKFSKDSIHVGVDAWNYRPVPMAALERILRQPEFMGLAG